MSLIDCGNPYDLLAKPDVDLDLPMKERKIGGHCIFTINKSIQGVDY